MDSAGCRGRRPRRRTWCPFNSIEWIQRIASTAPPPRANMSSLSIPLNGFTRIYSYNFSVLLRGAFQFHWMDSPERRRQQLGLITFNSIEWIPILAPFSYIYKLRNLSIPLNGFLHLPWATSRPSSHPFNSIEWIRMYTGARESVNQASFQFHWMDSLPTWRV